MFIVFITSRLVLSFYMKTRRVVPAVQFCDSSVHAGRYAVNITAGARWLVEKKQRGNEATRQRTGQRQRQRQRSNGVVHDNERQRSNVRSTIVDKIRKQRQRSNEQFESEMKRTSNSWKAKCRHNFAVDTTKFY